jgi:chemotaxis protein MotB
MQPKWGMERGPRAADTQSLWLIIYTDMVSNLVIFFLMLYGLTWLNPEEKAIAAASFKEAFSGEKGVVEKVVQDIDQKKEKEKHIEDKVRQEFQNVEVSEERIKIILPSPVLFDSGSADLKASTRETLHEIANIVKTSGHLLVVEGHTDNIPVHSEAFASNWELSSARAFSVIRHFIDAEKIAPTQLSAFGYAEFRPKAPNDTEENRAKNRRIEINIIKS